LRIYLSILIAITLCFAEETCVKGIAQDVHDGDSFKLKVEEQIIKVRIYGIDSPENKQPYGKEAGEALRNLINGKEVRLCIVEKDRYGRTVGEPWLGDSLNHSNFRAARNFLYSLYL